MVITADDARLRNHSFNHAVNRGIRAVFNLHFGIGRIIAVLPGIDLYGVSPAGSELYWPEQIRLSGACQAGIPGARSGSSIVVCPAIVCRPETIDKLRAAILSPITDISGPGSVPGFETFPEGEARDGRIGRVSDPQIGAACLDLTNAGRRVIVS